MDPTDRAHPPATTDSQSPLANWDRELLPHVIRAEANLLRLPLFALHTKGLKKLDGIQCTGRFNRNGEVREFRFRAYRNTSTLYPGPLSRSTHQALVSIITEQGFPLQNPVSWEWRDLCRRMKIQCGGRTVGQLQKAIMATKGLVIYSENALYSKPDGQPVQTRVDGLSLYDQVSFIGNRLPDGSIADSNFVWLADWYVNNLNARFTAPLDYALWRYLDSRSTIASRLYEYLLISFFSGHPVLRINYETLVKLLPVTPERYLSDAKRQLDTPLQLIQEQNILTKVEWHKSKDGQPQLHLHRGRLLSPSESRDQSVLPFTEEDLPKSLEVQPILNTREAEVVIDFYRLWTGKEPKSLGRNELKQAQELIDTYGLSKTKALIPLVVKQMKVKFPDAKTFGAIRTYVPDALMQGERQQRVADQRRQEKLRQNQEQADANRRANEKAALKAVWDSLAPSDQAEIREAVLAKQPASLRSFPNIVEGFCLDELSRRRNISPAQP